MGSGGIWYIACEGIMGIGGGTGTGGPIDMGIGIDIDIGESTGGWPTGGGLIGDIGENPCGLMGEPMAGTARGPLAYRLSENLSASRLSCDVALSPLARLTSLT